MKWSINRDSAEDKLRDFLEWMYAVKTDTLHHVSPHFPSLPLPPLSSSLSLHLPPSCPPSLAHSPCPPCHRTGSIVTCQQESSSHTRKHVTQPRPLFLSSTHCPSLLPPPLFPPSLPPFLPSSLPPSLPPSLPVASGTTCCCSSLSCSTCLCSSPSQSQRTAGRPSKTLWACSDQQWHVLTGSGMY